MKRRDILWENSWKEVKHISLIFILTYPNLRTSNSHIEDNIRLLEFNDVQQYDESHVARPVCIMSNAYPHYSFYKDKIAIES
jgi:hypothetical protein